MAVTAASNWMQSQRKKRHTMRHVLLPGHQHPPSGCQGKPVCLGGCAPTGIRVSKVSTHLTDRRLRWGLWHTYVLVSAPQHVLAGPKASRETMAKSAKRRPHSCHTQDPHGGAVQRAAQSATQPRKELFSMLIINAGGRGR